MEAPLSPFWYVAPANLVLFMGIAVLVLAAGMVETRRLGVLQRLSAAPVRKRAIVFGQMASMMVTAVSMAIGLDLRRVRAVPGALGQSGSACSW